MDHTVQVTCPNCRTRFREHARKMIDGFSRQCPNCEAVIFFNEDSPKLQIKTAMKAARAVRRALRDEADDKLNDARRLFVGSRNSQLANLPEDNN
jgi:Zn-finger nucleic acid-binding protein